MILVRNFEKKIIFTAVVSSFSYFRLPHGKGNNSLGAFIFIIIAILFALFTFNPPPIGLFQQPNSQQ